MSGDKHESTALKLAMTFAACITDKRSAEFIETTGARAIERALRSAYTEGVKAAWRTDVENAPDEEVHNVVGRYKYATAGSPRYAVKYGDRWFESCRHKVEEIIVWAWRPRDDWPQEAL